jgi:predicted MPP superfamily phosphohydrolase
MFSPFSVTLLLTVLLLAQILGWRLWNQRLESPLGRKIATGLFIAFNLAWLLTVWRWRSDREFSEAFLVWVARPAIGWQTLHAILILPLAALAFLLVKIGSSFRRFFPKRAKTSSPPTERLSPRDPLDRRRFLKTLANAGFFGLVGFSGYAVFRQYRYPDVKRLTVEILDLPKALDGFTIAQLSDVHIGLWSTERELDAAMSVARAERPDLVVLTGDLVDRDPNKAALFGPPFRRHLAKIPYGVYGVLGNHDHFTDPARIAKILREIGIRMLIDHRVNLSGLPLALWGLDDRGRRFVRRSPQDSGDPDVLNFSPVRGPKSPEGALKILLNHRPEGASQAARAGFRLYLAGHTHGGQYALPGTDGQVNLAALYYKYTAGLYPIGSSWLNVSAGLAAVGTTYRLVAWPEISLLRLKRRDQSLAKD